MAAKPDSETGTLTRAWLKFLGTTTGLVLVCVVLHLTGVVRWRDLVDLVQGREKPAAAADPSRPDDSKNASRPDQEKAAKKKDAPPVPVIPPNAAPAVRAKPNTVTFGPGELTKRVELAIDDEEPGKVTVATAVAGPGSPAGLIPATGLKITGTGATRFLDVTIDPEKWGTATVRVTATDREKLAAETTVGVTVPTPTFAIVEISDVSVAAGEPIPIVPVTIDDAARKPAKVTLTPVVNDPLFPDGSVTLDPDGKKLRLAAKRGVRGTATVTLVAQADDGREARRSFKVTVAPPPLKAGGKATVVLNGADVTTAIYSEPTGTSKQLGVDGLEKGTVVSVEKVAAARCLVRWKDGGSTFEGWVDKSILVSADDP